MTFRKRLQYFLVKRLNISNKNALALILAGKIKVNEQIVFGNIILNLGDSVIVEEQIVQEKKEFIYLAFYKPRGIETTLNSDIKDNLKGILPVKEKIFPVGRLDKESEGLLILTNDGRIFDKTLRQKHQIEKEYLATVDREIDDEFIRKMSEGINILGRLTLPCQVKKLIIILLKLFWSKG